MNSHISIFHYETEEPVFWPKCDEVDLADEHCPNCAHQLFRRDCSDCGGEGGRDGYEEDPLWYDDGDMIPCSMCRGEGFHLWCPRCRWDALAPEHWNRPEYRGMALVPVKAA